MKLLIILFTLGLSQVVNASGCVDYDYFLSIIKKTKSKTLEREDYRIISFSINHYSIALKSQPGKMFTLVKIAENGSGDKDVKIEDIIFTEGHGCGPVYDCETGLITLNNSKGTFVWPVLEEFSSRYNVASSARGVLIPVFGETTITPDSDFAQCKYGFW